MAVNDPAALSGAISASRNRRATSARVTKAANGKTTAKSPRHPSASDETALSIGRRVREVAGALGSNAKLAALLEIAPSQPTRWIKGSERPNSTNARAIVDLDHVVARANLIWEPPVVTAWLYGSNAFLDGARPIDVVKLEGAQPVVEALDQELSGGYA